MATIDNKTFIDALIAGNGYYETDARVALIVEYVNAEGRTTWGVSWSDESDEMQHRYLVETEYVRRPRILWSAD
jgi:hypothetical protein